MPDLTVFAPGRINLIGEHTDYSGGLVLPVAIDLGVTVRGRPDTSAIRLRSEAFGETIDLGCDGSPSGTLEGWGRYVSAVAVLLDRHGRPRTGLDGVIESTVPPGAGLSSSAALDVAVGVALCRSAGFELPPLALARLAREAELLAVGVPCGLMDPATALLGRRGHALLLDCGTEEYRHVPLPPEIAIVVLDSGVRHALEHSGYAARRAELERGLAAIGDRRPTDVTPAEAEKAARAAGVDELAARRLRHVVSENERVRRCVAALERPGGADLDALGALLPGGPPEPPGRLRGLDPGARPAGRARLRARRHGSPHDRRRLRRARSSHSSTWTERGVRRVGDERVRGALGPRRPELRLYRGRRRRPHELSSTSAGGPAARSARGTAPRSGASSPRAAAGGRTPPRSPAPARASSRPAITVETASNVRIQRRASWARVAPSGTSARSSSTTSSPSSKSTPAKVSPTSNSSPCRLNVRWSSGAKVVSRPNFPVSRPDASGTRTITPTPRSLACSKNSSAGRWRKTLKMICTSRRPGTRSPSAPPRPSRR